MAAARALARKGHAVTLLEAFQQLMNERQHILLVIDEYGGTDGLVTLEDLVETLLGREIVDEADTTVDMQRMARRQWRARAKTLGLAIDDSEEKA